MNKTTLYSAWAALFVLTAGLGFAREAVGSLGWLLTALSVLFFVPPGALLYLARKTGDRPLRLLIRNLCLASLGLTLALLVANFLSVLSSPNLGVFLHSLLTILAAPMICSGYWVLSIFLWACLLFASLQKK